MIDPEEKYKFINVVDDCVSPEMATYIEDICVPKKDSLYRKGAYELPPFMTYAFTPKIAQNSISPGVSTLLSSLDPQTDIDQQHHTFEYLCLNTLYSASMKVNLIVKNVIQGRAFMHMPNPNPGLDDIHTDMPFNHWVFLYYVNDSDGDTVFFKDDLETEITRVTPKKGRGIFFNGLINHCSTRPFKSHRCIFNYGFLGEKL